MPYTYILYSSKIDKFYVGACTDLQRRLKEHNTKKSKFTATGIPLDYYVFRILILNIKMIFRKPNDYFKIVTGPEKTPSINLGMMM